MMAASREYIRKAREDTVQVLAAADSDDQYHQSFLKNSVLIMLSSRIVAWTSWKEKEKQFNNGICLTLYVITEWDIQSYSQRDYLNRYSP